MIARTKESVKEQRRRSARLYLSPSQIFVLLAIYLLSDNMIACAYVRDVWQRKRCFQPPDLTEAEIGSFIAQKLLDTGPDKLTSLLCGGDSPTLRAAVRFACRQTCSWVQTLNLLRGVAPSSAVVAARYAELATALGASVSLPELHVSLRAALASTTRQGNHPRTVRKWAQRFRQRHGLRFGFLSRLPVPLSPGDIRQKAGHHVSKRGPKSGAQNGPQKWAPKMRPKQQSKRA